MGIAWLGLPSAGIVPLLVRCPSDCGLKAAGERHSQGSKAGKSKEAKAIPVIGAGAGTRVKPLCFLQEADDPEHLCLHEAGCSLSA